MSITSPGNQVTAHLRARVVREQVVGQAYRGYQIGLTEQLVTHGGLGRLPSQRTLLSFYKKQSFGAFQ